MTIFWILNRSSIGSVLDLNLQFEKDNSKPTGLLSRALLLNKPEFSFAIAGAVGAIANGALFPVIFLMTLRPQAFQFEVVISSALQIEDVISCAGACYSYDRNAKSIFSLHCKSHKCAGYPKSAICMDTKCNICSDILQQVKKPVFL